MTRLRLILSVALALHASTCAADTLARQTRGMATLEVHFEPTLTLADTLAATLIVEAPPGWEVSPPRDLPATSKWLLVATSEEDRETLTLERIRWRQTYRFAPTRPGDLPFTFPEVRLRDPSGDEVLISWDAVQIKVAAPTAAPDRAAIRGNTGIEPSPALLVPQLPLYFWLLLLPLFLLLIGLGILLTLLLRRKVPKSPSARALYEWHRLNAMNLPACGRCERFITLLTMLTREYLERAFDWPARRQTTHEFRAACECSAALSPDAKRMLIEFFSRAEAVKFAQVHITLEECAVWAEKVRHFLEGR